MGEARTILHVDMDAYFASVEILGRPGLRDRPVVVSGNPSLRTVVSSCNYIARRLGVRSGMPLAAALRLVPDAVIVEGSTGKYGTYTRRILKVLMGFTPLIEPVSIDEVFIELGPPDGKAGASMVAVGLQKAILRETGLWASIGIGGNKLLAKMASKQAKPRGICRLEPEDITELPVDRIWGVGPETTAALLRFGMRTIGDLRSLDLRRLRAMLGVHGEVLFFLCRGVDHTPLVPWDETEPPKSISHEHTFHRDVATPGEYLPVLANMARKVAGRSRDEGYRGSIVTLRYRLPNLKSHTRARQVSKPTDQDQLLFRVARELAEEALGFPIRLIGVSLGGLVPASYGQLELFEEPTGRLNRISDAIRKKFGERAVLSGRCLAAYMERREGREGADSLPPGPHAPYLLDRGGSRRTGRTV
ncbi:DNA polymerase IV [Candidatus Fermentibacterales bacterium]|nr:DNA polymerase IV [Candidatus Fermentibacterales bacterium]